MAENSRLIAELSREQLELLRLKLSKMEKKEKDPSQAPITRQGRTSNTFPLSFAQQRLWVIDQLMPGAHAYNIPTAVRLKGQLDVAALERATNEIVRRHESLRTTFTAAGGQPVQVIAPILTIKLGLFDLSGSPPEERETEAMRLMGEQTREPFDLTAGPLLRTALIRLDDRDHILVRIVHHIVSDKISLEIFVRELVMLYESYRSGDGSPLQELPIQYADYAVWQREWLRGEVLEKQLSYWKQRLRGARASLEIPTDRPRPQVQSFAGARHSTQWESQLVGQLERLSQREGCTLFMTLLAALKSLLFYYSRYADISVGTTISGRHKAETEQLIGFFVNTLVLRTDMSGDPTLVELLGRVREVVLGAEAHQYLPFERLVEELQIERDPGRHPLFQVIFNLQTPPAHSLDLPGLTLTPLDASNGTVKFDMAIFLSKLPEGLLGSFFYSTDLFDASTISRMTDDYETLLRFFIARPEARLSEALEEVERERGRKQAAHLTELKKSNFERLKGARRKIASRQ
nr:condensation domain-containing protein [uncultured bacterium]